MATNENYVEFVEYIVKALVDNPNDVRVSKTLDERGVLLTLDINPADMGYVIGRRGQNARAIRTLLRIVGARNDARLNLKINEPEGGRGPRSRDNRDDRREYRRDRDEDVDTSAVDDLKI